MRNQSPIETPPLITTVAVGVFLLSVWAASFSHNCGSDGCIGIVFGDSGYRCAAA
jgi:hypothetical protein